MLTRQGSEVQAPVRRPLNAATVAWLTYALVEGARWAPFALASIGLIALLPALFVAANLRKVEPQAKTPVIPAIVAIGLIVLGAGIGYLAV